MVTEQSPKTLADYLAELPLVAILRGLHPDNALAVGACLLEADFRIIEVPLNSPQPFESIKRLTEAYADRALIGAGTVLSCDDVERVYRTGAKLIVMPHWDAAVVGAAKDRGLICIPGIATPSEAFAALDAGADGLKLFPAELLIPAVLKAMRAVLAKDILMLPVGGITPDNMAAYWQAGASGFGLGSALYKADMDAAQIAANGGRFKAAIARLQTSG